MHKTRFKLHNSFASDHLKDVYLLEFCFLSCPVSNEMQFCHMTVFTICIWSDRPEQINYT